ncbi:MAG TPA: hypothetical protein VHN20_19550, partial [Beijerinckiaceae bacterium]|nr:hypothetical protein [Beijerinckiaceae bacterium]
MSTDKPPNAGKGRKAGSRNKTPAALKEAILHAFDEVGGKSYLAELARKDHRTFCALLGRILPRSLPDAAGEEDNSIVVEIVHETHEPRVPDLASDPFWARELAQKKLISGYDPGAPEKAAQSNRTGQAAL